MDLNKMKKLLIALTLAIPFIANAAPAIYPDDVAWCSSILIFSGKDKEARGVERKIVNKAELTPEFQKTPKKNWTDADIRKGIYSCGRLGIKV
jgi:hypothetical protein